MNENNKNNTVDDIQKLWLEYGIVILNITKANFLQGSDENGLQLPDRNPFNETSNTEYRITLGRVYSLEAFEDMWSYKTVEEAVEEYGEENRADIEEDWNKINNHAEMSHDNDLIFSVFLPSRIDLEKKYDYCVRAAWLIAGAYIKLLSLSIPEVYKNPPMDRNTALLDHTDNFTKFLNTHNIQINNQNLFKVINYSYRLYKDSKFFYELQEELGERKYNELIKRFIKLIH